MAAIRFLPYPLKKTQKATRVASSMVYPTPTLRVGVVPKGSRFREGFIPEVLWERELW